MGYSNLLIRVLHALIHFFHFHHLVCVVLELFLLRFSLPSTVRSAMLLMFLNFLLYYLFLDPPWLWLFHAIRLVLLSASYLRCLYAYAIFTTAGILRFISTTFFGSWGGFGACSVVVLVTIRRLFWHIMFLFLFSVRFLCWVAVHLRRRCIFFVIRRYIITFAFLQVFEANSFLLSIRCI